jgi:DNA end-binding protein Ku
MARALWSGSISFGLVNIPVKVVPAVRDKEVRFHLLHKDDGARIRFRRVCPKHGDVENKDIVRGHEVAQGQYVTFTDEELAAADPKAARTIDIQEFVELADIDPMYFDKPYYLAPDKGAAKPYALLASVLEDSGKVGIARVVMRDKEYLVALRPRDGALLMETMRFGEEVLEPDLDLAPVKLDAKEVALAKKVVGGLAKKFRADRHKNRHRDKVRKLIEAKRKGKKIVVEPGVAPSKKTVDLMEALESSLAQVRKSGKSPKRPPRPKRKGTKARNDKQTEDEVEA